MPLSSKKTHSSLSEVIYTSESSLKSPFKLIAAMMSDAFSSRELAWLLLSRDIVARYRQSLLGIIWMIVPAIVTALIFIFLNYTKVLRIDTPGVPYPVFVLVGVLLWQMFTESLMMPLKVTKANLMVLSKVSFPCEALLLSGLGQVFFSFIVQMLVLVIVMAVFSVEVTWASLLALPILLFLIILGFALGTMLSPIGTLFSDVGEGLNVVVRLWFFITPVAYPMLDEGILAWVNVINPVTAFLNSARDFLIHGSTMHAEQMLMLSAFAIPLFFVSWLIYRVSMTVILERSGA